MICSSYAVTCIGKELVSGPVEEPLTLLEGQTHLRSDHAEEEPYIRGLIVAARQVVEAWTNRALIEQHWKAYYDNFGGTLVLPKPKLREVEWVRYYDSTNVLQTVGTPLYLADTIREPGYLMNAYQQSWPSAIMRPILPIEVQFRAGYGLASAVPESIKHAMKLLMSFWYVRRESVDMDEPLRRVSESGAARLLDEYVVRGTE